MSISGVGSSSFFNTQNSNVQNQPQWQQEFQRLTQQLQAGSLASSGATAKTIAQPQIAAPQPGSQSTMAPTAQNVDPGSPLLNAPHGTPKHGIHLRHPHPLRVGAGNDGDEGSSRSAETAQPGDASSARQAYSSWQQNLQQVALNSDLLTAQNADWQPVSLSA